ncbi:16S rRNA processing protein RimM [Lachnospiraceae bacterium KH1T2]|nr:16S rRNA processing protein RimM [Lachnospiraceae bacterium KH1T2]
MSKLYSDDRVTAGKITSTHGIRGEVKVYPYLDDPDRFSGFTKVVISTKHGNFEEEIEKVRFFKNMVIVKFKGIDNINDVTKYRNADIRVLREEAADLQDGQYFDIDLIGLHAIDEEGKVLGELESIMHTGANDVYIIKSEDGGEILIPAIKQCILDVDLANGIIKIHLLEGLV